MRKAIGESTRSQKGPSGRRYWVRAAAPGSSLSMGECAGAPLALSPLGSEDGPPPKRRAGRSKKARFLEPYRLSDERRSELLELLGIAGVGDGEGRELFAAAVEYDIAEYRQMADVASAGCVPAPAPAAAPVSQSGPAAPEEPVPRDLDPAVQAIASLAEAARVLAGRLAALDADQRAVLAAGLSEGDRFRRDYGGSYLEAMGAELDRLADAAGVALDSRNGSSVVGEDEALVLESPEAPPPAEPPMGEAGRRFVCRVARVFEECLDAPVSVEPHSPFLAVLGLVAPEAGIPLPKDPADLTAVLAEG